MTTKRRLCIAAAAALAACNQQTIGRSIPAGSSAVTSTAGFSAAAPDAQRSVLGNGKIRHVIIIVQENRSVDDLFNGLPGADTVPYGKNSAGRRVDLQSVSLRAPYDIDHEHRAFEIEYEGGKMDGFNLERSNCRHRCIPRVLRAYGKVPHSEIQPYFDMAEQYVFADRMFQSNSGPSFPAHQYLVSGTATVKPGSPLRASENGLTPQQKFTGGCDAPPGSLVILINGNGTQNDQIYPCFDRPALTDLIEAKALTWRYYQAHPGPGLWNAFDAIRHVHDSSHYSEHVISPPSTILKDIKSHTLPNVVWVTPTAHASDHPGTSDGSGPSWVATVVDAIGESSYWGSTAILVTWDDWGGWYDHVKPPQYNAYELGFRVPLIVIGPYAKKSYVSHVQHEFGSILKFTEKAFGLASLGATDERADSLADCFNFNQKPRKFVPIKKQLSERYFLNQPVSMDDPDDE
jgi:phospholipase C